jgi:hypothetical protein
MYTSSINRFISDIYDFTVLVENYFNVPSSKKEIAKEVAKRLERKYRTKKDKRKFDQMMYYLCKRGFISRHKIGKDNFIFITGKGMQRAVKFSFKAQDNKKRVDGKLVMIVFDIPEESRAIRKLIRSVLNNLGYKMFQQSVWLSSYDVLEKTKKFIKQYFLSDYVKVFLVEKV